MREKSFGSGFASGSMNCGALEQRSRDIEISRLPLQEAASAYDRTVDLEKMDDRPLCSNLRVYMQVAVSGPSLRTASEANAIHLRGDRENFLITFSKAAHKVAAFTKSKTRDNEAEHSHRSPMGDSTLHFTNISM